MTAKTYGEYLEPVNNLIDKNFPEGTKITPKDLKVIAALTVATVYKAQSSAATYQTELLIAEGK